MIDIDLEIRDLTQLIRSYLDGHVEVDRLSSHAWKTIDLFLKQDASSLPPFDGREKSFWYAIWLLQHIGDGEHEQGGYLAKMLNESLGYLEGKVMPEGLIGNRPNRRFT